MESICAASPRLARILLSTATVILAGGFLFSPSLISYPMLPIVSPSVFAPLTRDGLEDLLASAISYSFDQF